MPIHFEDDFVDLGEELSNQPNGCTKNAQNGFPTLEKVTYRTSKRSDNQSLLYMVNVLPVSDHCKEPCIYMDHIGLISELFKDQPPMEIGQIAVCLASLDQTEVFAIESEIGYRKLLKIAKETNSSINFWLELTPYESNKLVNVNKKFDDLFLKQLPKDQKSGNSTDSTAGSTVGASTLAVARNVNSTLSPPSSTITSQPTTIISYSNWTGPSKVSDQTAQNRYSFFQIPDTNMIIEVPRELFLNGSIVIIAKTLSAGPSEKNDENLYSYFRIPETNAVVRVRRELLPGMTVVLFKYSTGPSKANDEVAQKSTLPNDDHPVPTPAIPVGQYRLLILPEVLILSEELPPIVTESNANCNSANNLSRSSAGEVGQQKTG